MAKKVNKILVPLDGSKNSLRGLDKAISIAKSSGAKITGFHVFHLPIAAGFRFTKSMRDEAQRNAAKIIGQAKRLVEQNGINFDYKTGGGKTGPQIIKHAQGKNYDMIIIGARGLGATKETFLGSVSNFVMHKSKVPVLVVK